MFESKIEYIVKTRTIDKQSKFVLIGNNIDGDVNVGVIEFEGFDDLKRRVPEIIERMRFVGEWNVSLYAVKNDFNYTYRWGYYLVPKRGKKVVDLSYMDLFDHNEMVIKDDAIRIVSTSTRINGNESREEERFEMKVWLRK